MINKLTLHVALYAADQDSTIGHWKSYDMLNPQNVEELEVLLEILKDEPESLGEYSIFKKVKDLKGNNK